MLEHDVVVGGRRFASGTSCQISGVNVAVVSKLYPVRRLSAGTRAGINVALGADDS